MSSASLPLRPAFWTLLTGCGLLAAAATTDPYAVHLAMNVPDVVVPPGQLDEGLQPVAPIAMPTMLAEADPTSSTMTERLVPTPAELPPAMPDVVRVATADDSLQIGLDDNRRAAATQRPVPVKRPTLATRGGDPNSGLRKPVPSPLDLESDLFPTLDANPQPSVAQAPSQPAEPFLNQSPQLPPSQSDAITQGDATAIRVAQLDILNQLKDLQKASTARRKSIADVTRSGGGTFRGDTGAGLVGDELGDDINEAEAVPIPVLESSPVGTTATGDPTFRLQIADAPVGQVLEMIGDLGELNIMTAPDVTGTVTNNLYDVTVEEALQAISRTYRLEIEREGKFINVRSADSADAERKAARNTVSKVYRPAFIAVSDLADLVTPLLTAEIGILSVSTPAESGIEADNANAGGDALSQPDALVVVDYAERITEIDRLVDQMDVPPPQVAIDAVIMSVRLNDQLRLGVNLAFAGAGNNELLVSGNGASISTSAGFPLPSVSGSSPITGGAPATEIIEPLGRLAASQAGLSFAFLRGDISGLFEALEEITDVSLVASPHVQVVNKQKAEIIIGERLGYRTLGFNDNQTIENIQFLDAGTKLLIRPFVGRGGLIRLEVHPERSSAQIDAATGLPQQQTTEVTTNVTVRDGQTFVIGGLIEEQVITNESQVPLLGSIPVLGRAFQNTTEQRQRTELIVLLTPRLVREEDAMRSEVIGDEFKRRADHFTESITPISRDRLAALHRHHATQALHAGDLEKAVHHIEKALHIDPSDLQTLRLRDEIAPNW